MRYVIVGLGNIGVKRREVLGSRCVACVDPVNNEAHYKTLDDVEVDCYDAAVLCVPNDQKIQLLQKLLSWGKHVLIEKPLLFPDFSTCDDLLALAKERNAVWYTSYSLRHEPLIIRTKQLLEQRVIGQIYNAKVVYGNGTVQNWIGTWREEGSGVVEDLGSHLVDLSEYLFGYKNATFINLEMRKIESKVIDRCMFATEDRVLMFECSNCMWKNHFAIDVFGELGSIHMTGLRKWGPTEIRIRYRAFPSGPPDEIEETSIGDDMSWADDFDEFEKRVSLNQNSYSSDRFISWSLEGLMQIPSV